MAKYYKKKPEWVKAWQYDGLGKTNMPEWVLVDNVSGYETYFSINESLTRIVCRGYVVDVGSWFVMDEFEDIFVLDDLEFRYTYEVEGDA